MSLKSITAALALVAAAAASAAPPPPPPLLGKATQVIDGNNLVIVTADGQSVPVRLAGIDAPEICQTWGVEARDALKDWVLDQPVSVKTVSRNKSGLVIGTVVVDGAEINRRMVEEGHAFSQRTKWDRGPYVKEERIAHSLARGMYSAGVAENPSLFKREQKACQ